MSSSEQRETEMNRSIVRVPAIMAAIAIAGFLQPGDAQALSYIVEQNTQYSSYGCQNLANADLSDDTASLVTALNSASWSGVRYTDPDAWPQDLWESCTTRACPQIRRPKICAIAHPVASSENAPTRTE